MNDRKARLLAKAVSAAARLDPEQTGMLIEAYRRSRRVVGNKTTAAWTMYAAMRSGVNPKLPDLGEFRRKTHALGRALLLVTGDAP